MNTKKYSKLSLFLTAVVTFFVLVSSPSPAFAMHIAEGFLPLPWAVFWWLVVIPFLLVSVRSLTKISQQNPELKLLIALAGAFGFVLSALKIPSVTGSSSHPTGVGLGTMLFGPSIMVTLGSLVLVFQAVLLAHGGLTTLGANIFSMAIIGPWSSFLVYHGVKQTGKEKIAIFSGVLVGNLATYLTTSLQLAFAFPAINGGVMASLMKFASIFAITQIPLGITEGLLTLLVWNWLNTYAISEMKTLKLLKSP